MKENDEDARISGGSEDTKNAGNFRWTKGHDVCRELQVAVSLCWF